MISKRYGKSSIYQSVPSGQAQTTMLAASCPQVHTSMRQRGYFLSKWIISQMFPSDVEKCQLLAGGGGAVIPAPGPREAPQSPNLGNWDMASPAAHCLLFRDSDRDSPRRGALSFLIISRSKF